MPARILIIDAQSAKAEALAAALVEAGLTVIGIVDETDDVHGRVEQLNPDAILIGVDSPTRDTLEGLAAIGRQFPRPILMLSDSADTELVRRAAHDGISAYAIDGLSPLLLRSLLEVSMAHFQNWHALTSELGEAQKALSDRRDIDRAKYQLMSQFGLNEDDAYHKLRRMAMERGSTVGALARQLVRAAATPATKDPQT